MNSAITDKTNMSCINILNSSNYSVSLANVSNCTATNRIQRGEKLSQEDWQDILDYR